MSPSIESRFSFLRHPLVFAVDLNPLAGRLIMLVLALLVSTLLVNLFRPGLLTLEERLGALGWTLAPDTELEERITLVAIDETSLAEVSPWPWPREIMADLVTAIDNAGAQLQLHDIMHTEAKAGDTAFLAALNTARGAVLAQVPVLQSDQQVGAGLLTHPLTGLSCEAAGATTQNYVAAHANFAGIPKGHITPIVDSDGAIRKVPAYVCVEGEPYPALALTAFLQATSDQPWGVTLSAGTSLLDPPQILRLDAYPGLEIPLDADGNLRISYRSSPASFQAVSARDVLAGYVDPAMFENAWVLVGATAFGMGDIVPTPYSGVTPGVELQARLITSVLDTAVPYTPRSAAVILGLFCLVFVAVLLPLAGARDRWSAYGLPVAGVLLPVLALGLHIQFLMAWNLWLGWIFPAIFGLCAAGLLLLLEQSRVRVQRTRVFGNLNSYLPPEVAREIAYSLPSSSVNARRCEVTLLNADLRNFSAFGETRPAEESAAVLHFFFIKATEIIEGHGGRIHEFKGDGLLAVWDGQNQVSAEQALAAAQHLQRVLHEELLPDYAPAGLEPLALGVGIEQGPVLIGSLGPAHRRAHTLLGDTVAITLRIQEMTVELAQPILLGECVARQLSHRGLESQGSYLLSGLRIPHVLFAPAPEEREDREIPVSDKNQPILKVLTGGRK